MTSVPLFLLALSLLSRSAALARPPVVLVPNDADRPDLLLDDDRPDLLEPLLDERGRLDPLVLGRDLSRPLAGGIAASRSPPAGPPASPFPALAASLWTRSQCRRNCSRRLT